MSLWAWVSTQGNVMVMFGTGEGRVQTEKLCYNFKYHCTLMADP